MRKRILISLISLIISTTIGFSQDFPCTATALAVNTTCVNTSGDNTGMTDSGIANPGCASYNGGDVWFSFTVPAGGNVTVTGDDNGGFTDGGMALYSGPNCSTLTFLACNDDGGPGLHSELTQTGLTAGSTIWVRYWEYGNNSFGTFNICVVDNTVSAPANDDPCAATALTVNASCTFSTYTNAGATASAGVPAPGCASYSGGDVWFSVTVPASGNLTIDSDDQTITDAGMAVYSGTCGSLSLVECDDDDSPNGTMSMIALTGQTPGATLWIRFWEYGNNNNGTFDICVYDPVVLPPPANDDPCSATALTVNASCTYSNYTNENATASAGVPAPGCASYSGGDVWFTVTVPASGGIEIDTETGVITDGGMAIYSGTCGSLTLVECDDDDSPNGAMSLITLNGQTPGATLWIRVWEYGNNNNGTFGICATEPPPPPPVTCVGETTNDFCAGAAVLTQGGSSWSSSTSSTYTADDDTGVNSTFCGSIENNSWYQFTAIATTETFNFTNVTNCSSNWGVQAEVFSITTNGDGCCVTHTSVSNCMNPGINTNGTVTASGLTIGNTYYLMVDGWGGDDCDFTVTGWDAIGILPIDLKDFSGITYSEYNLLKWTTASERNNDYFEMQRSTDGVNFEPFGEHIKGQGNVVTFTDYTGLDLNPLPGTTYYRLKQVDFNGEFTFTDVIALNRDIQNIGQLRTYPNPFNEGINIQFNLSEDQNVKIQFVNQLGKVVYTENFSCKKGGNKLDINTSFNYGIYMLNVVSENGEMNQTKRVIKK